VEVFDEIWEKVYSAEQQNQKEKFEVDLKKEIKKLQRLRDQIKTWIGSSDVKDKDTLIHTRKLIETKMEQFKICEKETKTKTYSKEGLARAERLSPEDQAKLDTCEWVGYVVKQIGECVDEKDLEIERLSSGKGKKTNRHIIDEYNEIIASHKFHINKLEGIMRLVMNDRLDNELVDEMKEDIEYYVDSHEDEDYIQSYDEEFFYESLGLDELDVVNVDRVTQAGTSSKGSKKDDESATTSTSKESKKSKKASTKTVMIPLTIGRARIKKEKKNKKGNGNDDDDDKSHDSSTPTKKTAPTPALTGPSPSTPAPRPPAPNANGGASMAAILKRESEQEKERQKQAALQQAQQQRLLQEQQARQQAEQLRQQQLLRQQEQLRQQEALRQQQQAAAQLKSQQEALQRQQQQQKLQEQQRLQQEAAAKQQQQLQAQQNAARQRSQSIGQQGGIDGLLSSGLGGLTLGNSDATTLGGNPVPTTISSQQGGEGGVGLPSANGNFDATGSYLGALDESFIHCPTTADSERQRSYAPRNPYPTPSSYPTTPSPVFENPGVFEKLGVDALFFIFYYSQGTYQQYLAARELKKQSWRYHKKYMTWFQRHEEPKVTTDEYEQGTYVYFDYESGWCQRIKSDFRFEYAYLEDSLSI